MLFMPNPVYTYMLPNLTSYKMHLIFSRVNQVKILVKESTNIKCDEINIMNIINDLILNLHKTFWIMTTGRWKLL